MITKRVLIACAGALMALQSYALPAAAAKTARTAVIPAPVSLAEKSGDFTITPKTTIGYAAGAERQAEYLRSRIDAATGFDPACRQGKGTITLAIDPKAVSATEGYTLSVTPGAVKVTGHDAGGVFYGIQTFLQLFPEQIYSDHIVRGVEWKAPCVEVADAPERPWRGMMLDVARYFHDKDYVKHYIDMMAMYKLNKLQFHLIDDSGWRLEIKKYPRLTQVGAYAGPEHDKLGGYYTQDDIREIVEYGATRNVEIVPEIEFPAHILSAVVAYPWLSCTGLQHELPREHFISRDLLCVGKESSLQFLSDVLDETVALFPSKYINIGGDEAVYTRWEQCPDCRALMEREGIKDASQLQGWLTNVVARMMAGKDRTVIGWEEIITRGKVDTPVVALVWHEVGDSALAVPDGHKAILTPATHMYLDFPESSTPGEIKAATWMPPVSLEKAYSMPVNDYSASSTVIGVQGCLWSDQFIHGSKLRDLPLLDENRSRKYVYYLTFPRLMAVAEVAWGRESRRDFSDFKRRVASHYGRLDAAGAGFRIPEPEIVSLDETPAGVTFTLAPSVPGSEIRYTVDGTYPTIHSPLYTGPVTAPTRQDFHAVTVVDGKRLSLPIYFAPDYSKYKEYGTFVRSWTPMQVQPMAAKWKFDATGKISGNGDYELTFIPTKGTVPLHMGNLAVDKRAERAAEVVADNITTGAPVTYSFTIDSFEAGTPFTVAVDLWGENAQESHGLVFIRKK